MSLKSYKNAALAGRYAKALLELAEESKKLKNVQSDMVDLRAMIENSPDFAVLIHSPVIKKTKQAETISAIAKKAKLDGLTQNFLGVLAQNGRLGIIEDVIAVFFNLCDARDGKVTVSVKTAQSLTAKQVKALSSALGKSMNADVIVEASVDESLLGGMVITAGSMMIDDSVVGKIKRLQLQMASASNENDALVAKTA